MIEIQNHRAGFIISGSGIRLNGFGTGRIDGNGDVWYDEDKGTSTEGRPMVCLPENRFSNLIWKAIRVMEYYRFVLRQLLHHAISVLVLEYNEWD